MLQRLFIALLALHAAATTGASGADLVSEALKLHAQSTVIPTHLLEDPELFQGRHLMADGRKLQAVQSGGRYVLIRNPTMQGGHSRAEPTHSLATQLTQQANACSSSTSYSAVRPLLDRQTSGSS